LSSTGGEKKTEHEIVVYPNVRASPTNIRASPTKQLAGARVSPSDEESSAAGAGAFNGEKDGKSILLFSYSEWGREMGCMWHVCCVVGK
jgi:hypothetical protein